VKALFLALLAAASWAVTLAVLWLCFRLCVIASELRGDPALRVVGIVVLVAAFGSGVGVFLSLLSSKKAGGRP
jgi:hypothetical protein